MKRKILSINGFTVVELSMVCAIIGVVIFAIAQFFSDSTRSSIKTHQSQDALTHTLHGMYWMVSDLKSASRNSIGSFLLNGGFETQITDTAKPRYWKTNTVGTGRYHYIKSNSTQTVHEGIRSVAIEGSAIVYDSDVFILQSKMAYMITGWVRCIDNATTATIALIVGAISSANTSSTEWTQLSFRWPASGTLASDETRRIRLSIDTGLAFFDDIAISPIYAVMASSVSANITLEKVVTDMSDAGDPVGFRFMRWKDQTPTMHRYRLGSKNNKNYIIREIYNETSLKWESTIHDLAYDIETLIFSYDESELLSMGKDAPITIEFLLRDQMSRKDNIHTTPKSVTIYPEAP